MAHEIQEHDRPVYHAEPAWHGLGLVVEDAPTPREALTLANLEWGVIEAPLFYEIPDGKGGVLRKPAKTHKINLRADNYLEMGVVSHGYHPVQNVDMADFCEALQMDKIVRCESVGSIWNGARVWFLLKGKEFNVIKDDTVFPYILVSNGHDGGAAFRVTPTTVRVVCSNTLHMVIPRKETGELYGAAVSFRHTRNVMERVEQAREALQRYGAALEGTREVAGTLAARDVKKEDLEKFFLECYTAEFVPEEGVPANPQNKAEERRRNKAMSAYDSFSRRFDDEVKTSGANMWTAMNAFTGIVQHDQKARGTDDAARVTKKLERNLFGLSQDRTQAVLRRALSFAPA